MNTGLQANREDSTSRILRGDQHCKALPLRRGSMQSEQTYAHQLKQQATKEVHQIVAGMKTALQVASSQSLPTEDLQATK